MNIGEFELDPLIDFYYPALIPPLSVLAIRADIRKNFPISVESAVMGGVSLFTLEKNKHPALSIFSTSSEQFSAWRDNNIDDNFWDPTEAMQIIHILGEFLLFHFEMREQLQELCLLLDLKYKDILLFVVS